MYCVYKQPFLPSFSLPLRAARTVQWTGLHSTSRWRHRHAVITVHRQVEAAIVQRCQSDTFCWMLQLIKCIIKYSFLTQIFEIWTLFYLTSKWVLLKSTNQEVHKVQKCHADYRAKIWETYFLTLGGVQLNKFFRGRKGDRTGPLNAHTDCKTHWVLKSTWEHMDLKSGG